MHDTVSLVSEVERQASRFLDRSSPHFTSLVNRCVDAMIVFGDTLYADTDTRKAIRSFLRDAIETGQHSAEQLQRQVNTHSWMSEDLQQQAWVDCLASGKEEPEYSWESRRNLTAYNKEHGRSCVDRTKPAREQVEFPAENLMHLRDCYNRVSVEHQHVLDAVFFGNDILVDYAKDNDLSLLDAMDLLDSAIEELKYEWYY